MSAPTFLPIVRVERLSYDQFRQEFGEPQCPVVITGATDGWPAMREWSFEWFKQHFGSVDVHLSLEETHTRRAVSMPLGDYIDRILTDRDAGLYMDQFPFERLPTLATYVATPYAPPERNNIDLNLWIGPAGTFISLHKDNHSQFDHINNIFAQLRGRKRVVLVSPDQDAFMYPRTKEQGPYWHSQVNWEKPDFERFPLFRQVRMSETVLHPGELLFIPGNYWHSLRSLDRSISVSCWWHTHRVADLLLTAMRQRNASGAGPTPIELADVVEFGGIARFAQALEADDLSPEIHRALWTLSTPEVRAEVESWRRSQCPGGI